MSSSTTFKMAQTLLLVAASSCWIGIVSANIAFVKFPAAVTLNPGDFFNISFTVNTPTNASLVNMNPFTLQLRAATQQRYDLQTNVAQVARTLLVQIPTNCTGGIHKFYADYQGSTGPQISDQITITGPPSSTGPGSGTGTGARPTNTGTPTDTGMSAGALAGIIGGVVVLFLVVALMFFCRHRRRVAERVADSRSMGESKEGFGAKNQGKESYTRLDGSSGGPGSIGGAASMTGGAAGGPRPRPDVSSPTQQQSLNAETGGAAGGPRPRPDDRSPNQQQGMNANAMSNNRNGGNGGNSPTTSTRNPFEEGSPSPRNEQYQPPQMTPPPPRPYQQSPFADPPMHQQPPRNQSPYQQPPHNQNPYQQPPGNRDSFESELESAYDPTHRTNPILNRNDSNLARSPLSHSGSKRYPHNTAPPTQNPFASQDEMMAVAAAVAAAASPVQGHRQLDPRSQSPVSRSASPHVREIEMQPLDIQQHHQEQQQRMVQRQQQSQASPKPTPAQPLPAAQQSINPTQFDDKAEIEEDSGPAYNGYRDTIFGAYAQNDDDEEDDMPVPMVPNHLANANNQASDAQRTGGAEIQRKKSVKFTGVPTSGPIVLPNHEAAKEHQMQKSKQQQQQQQQQQQTRPVSDQIYSDEDGDYDDDDDDEAQIQMRMIEQELAAASPVPSAGSRPYINTNSNASSSPSYVSALSPVHSPEQAHNSNSNNSNNVNDESIFGNDFYEDVIAAVDKNKEPESPSTPVGLAYKKPPMPPTPASFPVPPPQSSPTSQQQHFVQQQHIPVPQPQLMNKEVFGAPSPRIAPASLPSQNNQNRPPRANTRPSPPPGAPRQRHDDDEEAAFYASSLM
ncbi:hypothetical protein CPC16_008137 [Podila verticillata]|nr:hypothetical protein BGZ52_007751 [Haplosporangium bisporale]KAF9211582.1 hypothetical protein BGZ59_007878 [Podila verticillata]KAF9385081.1 hypothetical protein CPC16_008137 [Podila verticillata]KFH68123.1 hypothetical protein MVEG_06852 [Podila verticillata NRRL 6337]